MPDQLTHPSPEKLGAYSLGQLAPEEAAVIESHISECKPCCETIVGLSSDDTFVALLQGVRRLPADQTVDLDGASTNANSPPPDIPAPLAEHPRYEVTGLIGKGGMGDVYKARHRMMDRTVALKIVNRELVCKPEAVDRFHREVKTAARLAHPNIVTAHDAEQAGNVHFLAMEHVDGVDLAQTVKQQGALPITDACNYVRQAAVGLQYAHEMGMVHRDIKPHNLMVTADGTVKILDFGLASLGPGAVSDAYAVEARADLTAAGSIMGTPDFISPEQADDAHQADIRSDIYSLGTTLYYLLSGRPPFVDGSVMHKLKSHAQAEPEPIQGIQTNVPDDLAEVLRRMMAKDPAERFQTPAEVADALAPFVDRHRSHTPPPKKPPLKTGRDYGSFGWKATAVALLALIFGAVVAGVIVYVQTDSGTLVIESEDENIKIAVRPLKHESHEDNKHSMTWQYRIGDTVTGSTVKRLRSGAYIVLLQGRENDFELSQNRFVLKRGGRVVVKVTRREVRGPPTAKTNKEATVRSLDQKAGDATEPKPSHTAGDMNWRLVPAGEFVMGTSEADLKSMPADSDWFFADFVPERRNAERPQRRVKIRKPFYISAHEATVGQFREFVQATGYETTAVQTRVGFGWRNGEWVESDKFDWDKPGFEQPDDHPVCNVSWDDAVAFCKWLSQREGVTCRLPTEAEWEYACRAGTTTLFSTGDEPDSLRGCANLADASLQRVHAAVTWAVTWNDGFATTAPVGSFKPNAFGLYDMHGNVWEWCQDAYDEGGYDETAVVDPVHLAGDDEHVFRGGGFDNWPGFLRSADRYSSHSPDLRTEWAGFRVVREVTDSGDAADRLHSLRRVRTLPGHSTAVQMIAFVPGTNELVSAGAGHILRWNTTTGHFTQILTDRLNTRALLVSPDGKQIATGGHDGKVNIFNVKDGRRVLTYSEHAKDRGQIEYMAWSPDGQYIVSKSWSANFFSGNEGKAEMILWNATTGDVVRQFEQATSAQMLAFSPAGGRIVGADMDDAPNVWDVKTGKVLFELSGHTAKTKAVACSNDGSWIATGSRDGTCRVWNAAAGQQQRIIHDGDSEIGSLAVLPDDRHIVIASNDHLWLYEVPTGKLVAEIADIRLGDKQALAISSDGTLLATAETEGHFEVNQPSTTDIQIWRLPPQ